MPLTGHESKLFGASYKVTTASRVFSVTCVEDELAKSLRPQLPEPFSVKGFGDACYALPFR